MEKIKLSSFVLFVNDVAVSREFYEKVLDQEVAMDINGINIGFKSGLALWQKEYAQKTIFNKANTTESNQDNLEVYFETDDLDGIFQKVKESDAKILHPIMVQPWQQQVFRVYDPDRFIIEVAESMNEVIQRLSRSGMPVEVIVEKTFMPREVVEALLKTE